MKTKEATIAMKNAIEQLDTASGALYNALHDIAELSRAHHLPPGIMDKLDRLDIMLIDSIKEELEQLLED